MQESEFTQGLSHMVHGFVKAYQVPHSGFCFAYKALDELSPGDPFGGSISLFENNARN